MRLLSEISPFTKEQYNYLRKRACNKMKKVTRTIVIEGPDDWVDNTIRRSLPAGVFFVDKESYIYVEVDGKKSTHVYTFKAYALTKDLVGDWRTWLGRIWLENGIIPTGAFVFWKKLVTLLKGIRK